MTTPRSTSSAVAGLLLFSALLLGACSNTDTTDSGSSVSSDEGYSYSSDEYGAADTYSSYDQALTATGGITDFSSNAASF